MILLSLALAAPPVEEALRAEMDRAQAGLRLDGRPAPYVVMYDVLDGRVATSFAEFGAILSEDEDRYRNLRVDVGEDVEHELRQLFSALTLGRTA